MNQQNSTIVALGDVSELRPTGFGFEILEDGGYKARLVGYGNVRKKDNSGDHFKVSVVLSEPGFEGIEKDLYLQYPATNLQGMSEQNINSYFTFPKRNWLAFLSALGYSDEQISQYSKNLSITDEVIRAAPGGGEVTIGVRVVEENVLDRFGKETGRKRDNENRNFITRADYEKHSIGRKQAAQRAAGVNVAGGTQLTTAAQPAPAAGRGLGGGSTMATTPAPAGGFGGSTMPAPMGGTPNGAMGGPAPSAGSGLAGALGARPPA